MIGAGDSEELRRERGAFSAQAKIASLLAERAAARDQPDATVIASVQEGR